MKKHHIVPPNSQRKLRRHIQFALAGAALGTACMAMPSYADPIVNNTNSSGAGSLTQAIIDGGHVTFTAPVVNGDDFTVQQSITNDLQIDSASGITDFTVSNGLTTDNNAQLHLYGNGTQGDYGITSDLTAKGSSHIDISNAYTVNGNLAAVGEDNSGVQSWIDVEGSSIVNGDTLKATKGGGIGIYNGSTVTLTGDAIADGVGINGDSSEIYVNNGATLSAANLKATNGGYVEINNTGFDLGGNLIVDGVGSNGNSSKIYLHNAGLDAINLNITNAGYVDVENAGLNLSGDATVDGATSNGDYSELYVYHAGVDVAGDLNVINGGYVDIYEAGLNVGGDIKVDGVGSNDDGAELYVDGGNASATNLQVSNGGYVNIWDGATLSLTGDATVDGVGSNGDDSDIYLYNHSTLSASNLNVTNGGYVDIYSNSLLDLGGTGTATVDGVGSNGDASEIWIESDSKLDGHAVATNGGYLRLSGAEITGDVTIDANSMLRSYDYDGFYSNDLNTNGGTTSFNANSIFAPDIFSNPVTVDALNVSNEARIQPWLADSYPGSIPVGTAFGRSVIDYNSITGSFNTPVISPLDVGVEYADHLGVRTNNPDTTDSGQVQLYLQTNDVDFNKPELSGTENAHSLGSFLNNVVNQSNEGDDTILTLDNLQPDLRDYVYHRLQDAAYDGNLSEFDQYIPTNFSSHNVQAYWNQKSFVDSIRANLNNDRNSEGGAHAFALNQVSGASGTGAQLASLRQATKPGFNQLNYAGNNGSNPNGVWASYNGNHQNTDADSGIGSSDWSSSSDGFTLGYTSGGDRFSWGAAVGHQKSTLNFTDLYANGEQEGYNAGLYAAWKGKSGYLNAVLGYGSFDNDAYSYLGDASFKTKATSASLEIGKNVRNSKSSSLTPYASVLWTRVKQGDALVSGSAIGLTLNSNSNSIFATQLGVRYNHRMYDKNDTLKGGWQAGLAWLHQGGDTGFPVNIGSIYAPGAGTFAAKSTPLAGDSAVVQLGAYGRIHNSLVGFAGYQGTFGSSQKINAVNAGVGYQF